MTDQFPTPTQPDMVYEYVHDHDWTEIGARLNRNGTWTSVWSCSVCPDIGLGGLVGPIPAGRCRCGWVQKKWPRKRCEECRTPMTREES